MTNRQARIQRFLPTSLTLKDVAIVFTAAITTASPFFAFDAKFEALHDKYQTVQSENAALVEKNEKLTEQLIFLTSRTQVLEDSARTSRDDRVRLNQKMFELETKLNQRRR